MTSSLKIDKKNTLTVRELHEKFGEMDNWYVNNSPLAMSSVSVTEEPEREDIKKKRITTKHKATSNNLVTDNYELQGMAGYNRFKDLHSESLKDLTLKFKPPYNEKFLEVLVDLGENDDAVDACLSLLSWAAVGQPKSLKVYPIGNRDYSDEEQVEKDLKKLGLNKENTDKLLEFIRTVENTLDIDSFLQMAVYDALLGGRMALLIETFTKDNKRDIPVDTPAILKPLSFAQMGQNLVNKNDWRVRFIENLDVPPDDENRWLDVKDMIYFAWNDSNRNPGRWTYGRSICHALVKYSNILRQITERDIPEIITSFWMKPGILITPDDMDETAKQLMIDNLYQGGLISVNESAKFEPVDLKHDGWYLAKVMDLVIKRIFGRLKIPLFFSEFEAASRSVVESSVNVFRDFTVAPIQKWVVNILKKQFYARLLEIFVKDNKEIPEDILDKIEIIVVYDPFSIEDLLSKANSIELLLRRDVTTIRESRKMMRLPEKRLEDSEADIQARLQRQTMEMEARAAVMGGALQTANANGGIEAPNGVPVPTIDKNVNQQGIKSPVTRINSKPLAKKGAGATRKV